MVSRAEAYRWSSCQAYYDGKDYLPGLTNTELILSLFSGKREQAIINFRQFTEEDETSNDFLEDLEVKTMSDARACQVIEKALNKRPVNVLQEMSKADRDVVLRELNVIEGLSIKQISRLTGISFYIVKRA